MIHVAPGYTPASLDDQRRVALARRSWRVSQIPTWTIDNFELPRVFCDEGRDLPYVKDVLDYAFTVTVNDSIILTNSDIGLLLEYDTFLLASMQINNALWSHRSEFPRLDTIPDRYSSHTYEGVDLFAMRRFVWLEIRDSLPDLVMGAEAWDACLLTLMRTYGDVTTTPCVFHETHLPYWSRPENITTLPSQRHNLTLAHKFFKLYPRDSIKLTLL